MDCKYKLSPYSTRALLSQRGVFKASPRENMHTKFKIYISWNLFIRTYHLIGQLRLTPPGRSSRPHIRQIRLTAHVHTKLRNGIYCVEWVWFRRTSDPWTTVVCRFGRRRTVPQLNSKGAPTCLSTGRTGERPLTYRQSVPEGRTQRCTCL